MAMKQEISNGWIYIINEDATDNKKAIEEECKNDYHGTVGKYLFFSYSKQELMSLCKKILIRYNLSHGKVPFNESSKEYVLCIYDFKNRYSDELKQFSYNSIKYRYWKSDMSTIKGIYKR